MSVEKALEKAVERVAIPSLFQGISRLKEVQDGINIRGVAIPSLFQGISRIPENYIKQAVYQVAIPSLFQGISRLLGHLDGVPIIRSQSLHFFRAFQGYLNQTPDGEGQVAIPSLFQGISSLLNVQESNISLVAIPSLFQGISRRSR